MVPLLEESPQILAARQHWRFRGQQRPAFADAVGDGQVSVWDFPRPPLAEPCPELLEVRLADTLVASTKNGVRVCETAGAPTYYFPPGDVTASLTGTGGFSVCEWKGQAESLTIAGVRDAGWRYVQMFPAFTALHLWVAFYPSRLACFVDGERVKPQPGGYYGGWVTSDLVGPIKGEPESGGW